MGEGLLWECRVGVGLRAGWLAPPLLAAFPSPHSRLGPLWGHSQTAGSFIVQTKVFLFAVATDGYSSHLFPTGKRGIPFQVSAQENRTCWKDRRKRYVEGALGGKGEHKGEKLSCRMGGNESHFFGGLVENEG